MEIFAKIDFWGLKCPHEVLVGLKTCSAICGTHVQTILNHKDLTGSAAGVREGQNTMQYGANGGNFGPYFDLTTPPPANLVKSLWFKMGCTCVPLIVLHVFSSKSTSWGYIRPEK